jgi:glycosyltransferase involved in cell wall biosynthesis
MRLKFLFVIKQHSVDDGQLGVIDQYRLVCPQLPIIQMVDDLLGEVPSQHTNRNFQVCEGHQRMAQALKKSDRLIVTTETLQGRYGSCVPDVWLVPNTLDQQWQGHYQAHAPRTQSPGQRLRIGWVGSGQHKGDLDMVTEVVRALAPEVDWVFMGMCTEAIKPLIKENHEFVPIDQYPAKMVSLQLDIAIAPLEQGLFNECKSNLRLLEYGAMGWPVVCSDVFPYRYLKPPVLRCANDPQAWLNALRRLMQDAPLRRHMGAQLHHWVQTHFMPRNRVTDWKQAVFGPLPKADHPPLQAQADTHRAPLTKELAP